MAEERFTIQEAARRLGVKEDAIRKRVRRGTLRSEEDDGRRYVFLDAAQAGSDTTRAGAQVSGLDALLEEMRARIADLKDQLGEEREARRRADTIIAKLSRANEEQARTIRALEAPTPAESPPESPVTASEEPEGEEEPGGAQEPISRRSWWRRIFGG